MAMTLALKKVATAFSLAWKKEANWASAPVYLGYALTRPLCGALIIWVMAVAAGRPAGYLPPAWFSNAFFQIVPAVLGGTSWAILEDRERYQMLKYIYLAPGSMIPYGLGNALARTVQSLFGAAALLAAGALVFGLRPAAFHPFLFSAALVLGLVALLFLGLALAGTSLLVARHGNFMTEAIGGVFFLFSGAVFPVDTLPGWMLPVACASPVTWWLEALRRSFGLRFGRAFDGLSDAAVLAILAAFAVLCVVIGVAGWNRGERRAKWKGLIDATTAY